EGHRLRHPRTLLAARTRRIRRHPNPVRRRRQPLPSAGAIAPHPDGRASGANGPFRSVQSHRHARRRPRDPERGPPDHLSRLTPSDWRVLACHLYRLLRRHDPRLADRLWHPAWAVDQGFSESLSVESLPTTEPAARRGLNARTVRRLYEAVMHDLRGGRGTPPLATRDDRDIMSRILARLFTELELE